MYKTYVFEDGYYCIVKGFSKQELKNEMRKHGKVIKITAA